MITPVLGITDEGLYATWRMEEGGLVSLVVPDVGEVRMTLDKAQAIGASLLRQAEYGRWAIEIRKTHEC